MLDPDAPDPPGTRLRVGAPPPALTAPQRAPLVLAAALLLLGGVIITYALVGRPVSSRIGGFRPDRPAVRQLAPRGVAFVGIAILDQEQEAKAFLAKHGITYAAAIDTEGAVMRDYRITAIPTTVVIDRDGRIAERYAGIFVGDDGRARLLAFIEATRVAPP